MSMPNYLRKPKHKGTVVATSKGWVLEETGELLVRVKDLDKKLAEHLGAKSVEFSGINTIVVEVETASETDAEALTAKDEDAQEETEDQPKRRGRPPKAKAE